MRAASDKATPSDARNRAGLDDCCDNLNEKSKINVSKSSNLLKKSASCSKVEGVTSVGAHGTAQKASVSTCAPPSDWSWDLSEVHPELEGKEIKIGEVLNQELSAKDNKNLANVTASESDEKEDAVDALLKVPREWMPENPDMEAN